MVIPDPDLLDAALGNVVSELTGLAEQLARLDEGELSELLLGRLLFLAEEMAEAASDLSELSAGIRARLVELYRLGVLDRRAGQAVEQ